MTVRGTPCERLLYECILSPNNFFKTEPFSHLSETDADEAGAGSEEETSTKKRFPPKLVHEEQNHPVAR